MNCAIKWPSMVLLGKTRLNCKLWWVSGYTCGNQFGNQSATFWPFASI